LRKDFPSLFTVLSAGFVNPGKRATGKMRAAMAKKGYDLEAHRSQLVTEQMVRWAKYVVLMDGGNLRRFQQLFPHAENKVIMLGDFADPPVTRIPDPNYLAKDSKEFTAAVALILQATGRMGVELA
jgi:protein-tyrosine-phosphatase